MILITGAGGYIGRHLARALRERGEAVRCLDVRAGALVPLAALGAETLVADAGDEAAVRAALVGVTVVYHLAGSALGSPAEIARANVAGARAVAAACAGHPGLQALVYAGSGALYPSGPGWLDETTPPAPGFHYARAKHEAERVLLEARARHGLPVLVARIAAVYGPASPAMMVEQVRHGRFPLIGGGRGYASNIYIDDAIAALLAMPERGRPGQIYNLADDEPAPVAEFYGQMARLLGAPPPPTIAPAVGRALVWLVGTASRLRRRPMPLPIDMVDMAAVSHRMANRRMRDDLGVTPRYPSYREGLPVALGLAPAPPH
ncbi:MAG: NAD-dependent epimerase/dehydratase family protein [Chloroflexales bacterium]|nr:NAD-dependent epimerase/dehydratase family protein [Chloroflexales bacterium]